MTHEFAEVLARAAERVGVDARLRDDYPREDGYGVVFSDWIDVMVSTWEAGRLVEMEGRDLELLASNLRWDSMGRSLIVY